MKTKQTNCYVYLAILSNEKEKIRKQKAYLLWLYNLNDLLQDSTNVCAYIHKKLVVLQNYYITSTLLHT